jgi:glycoside transferase family 32
MQVHGGKKFKLTYIVMIRIPKIIHQTWKDEHLPEFFQILAQTWRDILPDWEYHLWTDEMNREFVRSHYPKFLQKFDAYPNKIQRADAIRYLLLQTYGGLYVDLDFECLEPKIITILEDADFIAGKEPYAHARRYGREYIICNALMASVPRHPFIKWICDRMINHSSGWDVHHAEDILASTGPFLLTDAYNDYINKEGIRLIEPKYLYPIRIGESNLIIANRVPKEMEQRINKAYAIHYFSGTWW